MKKVRGIRITEINDAKHLVALATQIDGDVIITKGKYCVDCKSLIGVFALDLSTGVTIEYPEDVIEFDNFIKKFI